MAAWTAAAMLVLSSAGCGDDSGPQHCDSCNFDRISAHYDECVMDCTPDCSELTQAECAQATDRCKDRCDGCGRGLLCGRRGDGAQVCFRRDDPFDRCIDVF